MLYTKWQLRTNTIPSQKILQISFRYAMPFLSDVLRLNLNWFYKRFNTVVL